jgi:hypothetical protein
MLPPEMQEEQPMESKPAAQPRSSVGGRRRGRRGGRGRGRGPRRTAAGTAAAESAAPAPIESEIPAAPSGETTGSEPVAPVGEQPAQAESPAQSVESPIRLQEMPVRPAPSKPKFQAHPPAVHQAASHAVRQAAPVSVTRAPRPGGSVIGQTVDEVRQIVESLEQSLEQMEEVLRLVELAEQQKFADERELESLRRALHKLQPPRRERREDEH